MKIFIAGKITGEPKYQHQFGVAERRLKRMFKGCTVLNPTILPDTLTWEDCMILTMEMVSISDKIYMLVGWEDSMGAKLEHDYASKYNIEILYEAEGLCSDD